MYIYIYIYTHNIYIYIHTYIHTYKYMADLSLFSPASGQDLMAKESNSSKAGEDPETPAWKNRSR